MIIVSCHLRSWLCALDLNCTVLQINMCCCKSLYNILLIRLFLRGSCIDIPRTYIRICPCNLALPLSAELYALRIGPNAEQALS